MVESDEFGGVVWELHVGSIAQTLEGHARGIEAVLPGYNGDGGKHLGVVQAATVDIQEEGVSVLQVSHAQIVSQMKTDNSVMVPLRTHLLDVVLPF